MLSVFNYFSYFSCWFWGFFCFWLTSRFVSKSSPNWISPEGFNYLGAKQNKTDVGRIMKEPITFLLIHLILQNFSFFLSNTTLKSTILFILKCCRVACVILNCSWWNQLLKDGLHEIDYNVKTCKKKKTQNKTEQNKKTRV